jgi:hypothetical protein
VAVRGDGGLEAGLEQRGWKRMRTRRLVYGTVQKVPLMFLFFGSV